MSTYDYRAVNCYIYSRLFLYRSVDSYQDHLVVDGNDAGAQEEAQIATDVSDKVGHSVPAEEQQNYECLTLQEEQQLNCVNQANSKFN